MTKSKIQEKKQLFDFTYNFNEIIKKEKWVPRYDIEADSFSFSVPKLPDDARLKYFGDEFAFYISGGNKIRGIFIEYFNSNFTKHNKDFRKLTAGIQKGSEKALVKIKKDKITKKIISGFSESMKESLLANFCLK
ncbi:hypothetical protein KJ885_04155 [Patescibacteria group bacterium]|nr:hypothetical protein [Patescibacteria group bacterium]